MQEFWAMTDLEKLILALKVLLVGFGWGALIFSSLLIILLTVDYLKEWIEDAREDRLRNRQLLVYSQATVEIPRQRQHWADQPTDVFKIAEEISK